MEEVHMVVWHVYWERKLKIWERVITVFENWKAIFKNYSLNTVLKINFISNILFLIILRVFVIIF